MLDKLDAIKGRFDNLGVALTNPEIVSDNKKYTAISKEYRSLEKIVLARNAYVSLIDDIEFNKEVLNGDDAEMRDLAKQELPLLDEKKEALEKALRNMLIPKDPYDEKNAMIKYNAFKEKYVIKERETLLSEDLIVVLPESKFVNLETINK